MHFLKIFVGLIITFLILAKPVLAESVKQVVIVNPIRGEDFWDHPQSILDTPQKQYELLAKNSLPATWLIRFDVWQNPPMVEFLKSLNNQQEVGLFLEITPSWAKSAGVIYNQKSDWHHPASVFLTGYLPEDRQKLIDTAFTKFKDIFNVYPKSVGAWWIDANSLSYMHDKYGVVTNLDVADQYSTDQYQVWGQYWSLPFYPAKSNALIPAKSPEDKLGLVTIQWATRDPYNGYGHGTYDSTYSVQANDYLLHSLTSEYFEKLLNIYPQVTIGLENDFSWQEYGFEYQKQIELLSKRQKNHLLSVKSMDSFADDYRKTYPQISPNWTISADDPLGSGGKVVWYQTPHYRMGWFYHPKFGSMIRDLRIYDDSTETCSDKPCDELNQVAGRFNAIDFASNGNGWLLDEGKIDNFTVKETADGLEINYQNQAGSLRHLKLLSNDIDVNGKVQTLSGAILNIRLSSAKLTGSWQQSSSFNQIFFRVSWLTLLIDSIKFILLTILFFFLPGWILSESKLLAIPVGWSLFTFLSYILGFLKWDLLIWGLPLLCALFLFKSKRLVFNPVFPNPKMVWPALVIVLGSLSWLITVIKSGLNYDFGLGFWGPNGHDGIWHLALISELQRNFPPQNPVFGGTPLFNYHYFFDLLLAKSGWLFQLNNEDLLFRFFPLLITTFSGLIIYQVTEKLFHNFKASVIAVFLLYFGGSFGWLVNFVKDRTLGGESMFWAQQSVSTLLNPPFAISVVLFLTGFYLYQEYQNKFNLKALLAISIVWGTLIEFKAYAGVLTLISLGFVTLEQVVLKRKFTLIPLLLSCLMVAALVFWPNNQESTSLFIWAPFWFVTTMIVFSDRLNWVRVARAIESGSQFKLVVSYILGSIIFLGGNFGSRMIGLAAWKTIWQQRFLFYVLLIGTVTPFLVIQKGTNWNSIQFFYYSILILAIFAALEVAKLWEKLGKQGILLVVLIIFITIPTSYSTVAQYLPLRPPAKLSNSEDQALKFLKNQPPGIVLTLPFEQSLRKRFSEPVPLFVYTTTAYVSAFSGHPTFLEDQMNLDILGVDYNSRLNDERDFMSLKNKSREILKKNNISYVYIVRSSGFEEDAGKMGIKLIFENEEVKIFKVI